MHSYDVAIIGGGLAGNLVARQLRRQLPDLSVAVFEKARRPSYKVGESTVEIASHYLIRRLGLSRYLYEHQLPKNGLRFFFDSKARDTELTKLSEMGGTAFGHLPSFQVDRARLEIDLRAMNAADGVALVSGRVKALDLETRRFEVLDENGERRPAKARYVIDASGRAGVIAKRHDLWQPRDHTVGAVWGRFRGVVDLDDHGPEAWRARVNHTSRVMSTNHFCYPGYWIWFIPLGSGLTSVGVVIDKDQWSPAMQRADGFEAFLKRHRAVAELLAPAELVDVLSYRQLAYGSTRYLGPGWACIGEAAAFSDPLYSPGSDFIALENDFVVDLVGRELTGEDVTERRAAYDAFLSFRFEATMRLYEQLYGTLGSYELYRLKWFFDIGCYYDLWLEPYMRDEHLELGWLERQLKQRDLVLGVLERFRDLFLEAQAEMRASERYFLKNIEHFTGAFPTMQSAVGLGSDDSARRALARCAQTFNLTRRETLGLLDRPASADLSMRHFLSGKPLL